MDVDGGLLKALNKNLSVFIALNSFSSVEVWRYVFGRIVIVVGFVVVVIGVDGIYWKNAEMRERVRETGTRE